MEIVQIKYSLGFNFDDALIDGIAELNANYGGFSRIDEVFGALPDAPVPSARPTYRISDVSLAIFKKQVERLQESAIEFNFLMNTAPALDLQLEKRIDVYVSQLADLGVSRLTVGSPELCAFIKSLFPDIHVTLSITYGVHSIERLKKGEAGGADAIYLDGVFVNRNFELLRSLVNHSKTECRLYANMSCLSKCPVVHEHYELFGIQSRATLRENDAFFAGCTLAKLKNPVEWLQMPWIRPEDIAAYFSEGISHFKLADRLAPTETLLTIARSYLIGESPENMFELIERDGAKYKNVGLHFQAQEAPICISSTNLPRDFLEHFRSGSCKSDDPHCDICLRITRTVIRINPCWLDAVDFSGIVRIIPQKLRRRARL